jgi:acyl-CoA:6-aminopenicillanic acid acyl transferase
MWTAEVPTYVIDLQQDETSRWREVIDREKLVARELANEAVTEFERVPEVIRWVFGKLYEVSGGRYKQEINTWASVLGVSSGTATLLNCFYELSHVRTGSLAARLLGCTAGVRWFDGLGMVQARTLDWSLTNLGNATRLFCFRRGKREFFSVGFPGFVGVLSGMLPHRYSVTINWAPPIAMPSFDFGPAFLLRETLEECDRYDEAVDVLTRTPLSTSVFYTVVGVEKGQACVIERTQSEAVIRQAGASVLVQANHHVAEQFSQHNQGIAETEEGEVESTYADSQRRAATLEEGLKNCSSLSSLAEFVDVIEQAPVLNEATYQKMIICPSSGEIKVWRRLEP